MVEPLWPLRLLESAELGQCNSRRGTECDPLARQAVATTDCTAARYSTPTQGFTPTMKRILLVIYWAGILLIGFIKDWQLAAFVATAIAVSAWWLQP